MFQETTGGKRRHSSVDSNSSQTTAAKKKKVDCSNIQVNSSDLSLTKAGDSDSDIDYCVI